MNDWLQVRWFPSWTDAVWTLLLPRCCWDCGEGAGTLSSSGRRLFTKHSSAGSSGAPELLTYTTVPCQLSETRPAIRPTRRETPRAPSNRNSPPTSLFPLPHCATMRAGRWSCSLAALGEGRELTYGFSCIIAWIPAQLWHLSWNSSAGKLHPPGPPFFTIARS